MQIRLQIVMGNVLLLKFIYSEKATKLCEIFTLLLTVFTVVKSKVKISQNCVAFSEHLYELYNSLKKISCFENLINSRLVLNNSKKKILLQSHWFKSEQIQDMYICTKQMHFCKCKCKFLCNIQAHYCKVQKSSLGIIIDS